MQPSQDINNLQPATNNPVNTGGVVFQDKPKRNTAMILGMVLLAILAIGGIGFGVWEMMDANSQKEQLNSQINDLKQQISELQETTNTDFMPDSIEENPIITAEDPESYTLRFNQSIDNDGYLSIFVKDGAFQQCMLSIGGDCDIRGLPNNIFKMATIGWGNGSGNEKVGFITKDGEVWYIPVYKNNSVSEGINDNFVAQKVDIDGFVKDIVQVNYSADTSDPVSTHRSTVFILDDGSIVNYESLAF